MEDWEELRWNLQKIINKKERRNTMARRYRYEYRQRKKAREQARQERLANMSDREKQLREVLGWIGYIVIIICASILPSSPAFGNSFSRSRAVLFPLFRFCKTFSCISLNCLLL